MVIGIFNMTIRLYLMRHATAVPHGSPGYAQDHLRPLTNEGRDEARAVARGLKRLSIQPDRLLASPYVRARQTAEEVARILAPTVVLEEMLALRPESDPRETSSGLKVFRAARHLLFFGHEPHLSAWIAQLVDPDAGVRCLMKKAGVACVEIEQFPPVAGAGLLRWLMTPKQLVLIGKDI